MVHPWLSHTFPYFVPENQQIFGLGTYGNVMEHPAGHLQWGAKASREVVSDEAATSRAGRHVRSKIFA